MATFDIFNNDAFSLSSLTQTIVDQPTVPTKIGDKGLFAEEGITTTTLMIERQGSSIKLVPAAPRGGVREPVTLGPRKLIVLPAIHLPQSGSVLADEVQGIRAFGSETEVDQAVKLVARKLKVMKDSMDLTIEYHRIGAIKGQVLDADGSLLLDVYGAFGMTQVVQAWNIDAANTAADPLSLSIALKSAVRAKLGGRSFTSVRVLCSLDFFTKFTAHDNMKKAWALWNNGAYLRTDQTDRADFEFAGVKYEIYEGGTSAGEFIPAGEAYAYAEGVPGLFQTKFAPGDYMETVNTQGLPYYAKQERMSMDKGVMLEAQSNPLNFCSLPETVIKLKSAATV